MPAFYTVERKCSVCGKCSEQTELASTSEFGNPDLDLRPPMMGRHTMSKWIEVCPWCGYAYSNLEEDGKGHAAFVASNEYKSCESNPITDETAQNYYRFAMLLKRDGKRRSACDVLVYAAWACDDADDSQGALICRGKAIELFDEKMKENENLLLRQIDLLRRTERFDEAIALCDKTDFGNPFVRNIVRFQKVLSQKKDAQCHNVGEYENSNNA